MTARCQCGIDVHAHVVPREIPRYLPQPDLAGWPSMAEADACHRHVMIDGRVYRTVAEGAWSTPRRLSDMAEMTYFCGCSVGARSTASCRSEYSASSCK